MIRLRSIWNKSHGEKKVSAVLELDERDGMYWFEVNKVLMLGVTSVDGLSYS